RQRSSHLYQPMLWLWMIFSEEGHLRVPTLKNYLLQNNDFTKAFFYEDHLPPYQRLKWYQRAARLACYFLLLLTVSARMATLGLQAESSKLEPRAACREACEEAHYPFGSLCKDLEGLSAVTITRHGNQYDRLFYFPVPPEDCAGDPENCPAYAVYLQCRAFVDTPSSSKDIILSDGSIRKQRHEICFNACRRPGNDTEENGFIGLDTRPPCAANSDTADLLCVSSDDGYESQLVFYGGYTCFSGGHEDSRFERGCTSWSLLWLGILIANVIQALTEMMIFYVTGLVEDVRVYSEARNKCLGHSALTVYFLAIIILLFQPLQIAETTGRGLDVLVTVVLSLLMDQAKNFVVQPVIWWVLIRRCGTIFPGIQEYNEEYLLQWDLQDSLVMSARMKVQLFFETKRVTLATNYLVGGYAILILSQLATQDYWEAVTVIENIYKWTDFATVCIFMVEITFKTFAYWVQFWMDPWNFVDNIVVIASFIVAIMAAEMKGLGLLRLLKLLRIMVVIRKVSEGRKKLKDLKTKSAVTVGSYVDKVLELIEELQTAKYLPPHLKDDLDWVKDVIVCNKLYEVSIDADTTEANSDGTGNSDEMTAWITAANGAPVKSKDDMKEDVPAYGGRVQTEMRKGRETRAYRESQARRESRYKTRSQSRRQSSQNRESQDNARHMNAYLYKMGNLTPGEQQQIESALSTIDSWRFDVFQTAEILEGNLLPILFGKMMIAYDLVDILSLDFEIVFAYASKVQESFHPQVQFHNAAHTADMIQAIHIMYGQGRVQDNLNHLERFALLFSALICHMRHPGLTNDFLVKARTPEAIRYNDIAVLQHCHLAHASGLLEDPELNFLLNVESEIVTQLRKLVIHMVLRLDISRHMTEITNLTSAMASEAFPSREEDIMLLLSVSLRVADVSWACRPQQIYGRWAEKFLEELYLQGDLEKVMGRPVSPFCDRDAVQSTRTELAYAYVMVSPLINAYT
ncbi:hypothetical protein FOZ62_018332, partial [Perkinsus olseni]